MGLYIHIVVTTPKYEALPMRLTFTLVAGVTLTVSGRTFTLVGSYSVDTVPSGTEAWHSLAFIHI